MVEDYETSEDEKLLLAIRNTARRLQKWLPDFDLPTRGSECALIYKDMPKKPALNRKELSELKSCLSQEKSISSSFPKKSRFLSFRIR
jgi:hypothetical protein